MQIVIYTMSSMFVISDQYFTERKSLIVLPLLCSKMEISEKNGCDHK